MSKYHSIALTKDQKKYLQNIIRESQPKNIEEETLRIAILVKLEGRKKTNAGNV